MAAKTAKKTAKLKAKVSKVASRVKAKVKARAKVAPIPKGYHALTPHLVCRNAAKAIEFYKKAFGAKELNRMPGPGGLLMHAELQIGDSRVMLSDEMPEMGAKSPQMLGGNVGSLMIYSKDVDAAFKRALDAGAKETMPVSDQFWGDRYGKLEDPFGHGWAIATRVEVVSPKEMMRRMEKMMAEMGPPPGANPSAPGNGAMA